MSDNFGDFRVTTGKLFDKSSYKDLFTVIVAIFGSVLLILMACSLLRNGDSVTFTGFLEFLSNQGTNFALTNFVDYSIVGDWGLFNFLKDFINLLMIPVSVTVYLLKLALNVLLFFFGLLRFLFGF